MTKAFTSYTTTIHDAEDASVQGNSPNDSNIDIYSKEGAEQFVDFVGHNYISTHLTATDDEELDSTYTLMIAVAEHASTEKIASGIPGSELRTFIEHARNTLDTLSTDRNWLRSGTVSMCHAKLLQAIACFANHPSFLNIFLSNEGMEAVVKFYASRTKNDTPSHLVAKLIVLLVNNTLWGLEQQGVSCEKGFGTIEKTGLLGQFIRCVPVDPEWSAHIVRGLQTCLQLLKKKLKSGTPTGEILDAVIAGKDGPINEKGKAGLARLQGLARLSNINDAKYTDMKMCHHCNKLETLNLTKLMKCQRCKESYYCSKDCQVADWKSHKKTCKEQKSAPTIESRSASKTSSSTMWAFVKSNYFDIAKEVYKKTQEYNVPKKELFVDIDFYGDAPALRNEFKVRLTSDFLEGSSVADAPEWFRIDADKKPIAMYLREEFELLTSDHLLVVYRAGNRMVTVKSLNLQVRVVHNRGYELLSDEAVVSIVRELLSDEAVESIGREDYVRMVACLGEQITNRYFEKKSGLE
jgi:hypothetical protein